MISEVKAKIQEKTGVPATEQLLVWSGKVLDDRRSLQDYGIGKDDSLDLRGRLRGSGCARTAQPGSVKAPGPPKDSVKENTEQAPTSAPSHPGDPEQSESVRAESEARGLSVYYLCHVLPKEVKKAGGICGHTCTSGGGEFCGKAATDCASGCGPPTPHDINKPVLQERSKGLKCPRDGELGCAFVDYVAQETPEHVGKATRMLSYTWGYSIEQIGTALEAYCEEEGLDPKTVYVWICFACINQHRVTGNKPCIHI